MTAAIATDGDAREQWCWPRFLRNELPSYELVWATHIVPLTRRPVDIKLKSDAELALIGKSSIDICFAQLHYSVLCHLHSAFVIRARPQLDFDAFHDGMVRLCSAQDVAFELLQRHRTPKAYDVTSETQSLTARRTWQTFDASNLATVKPLRTYRNRLAHGRITPWLRFGDAPALVPKVGSEGKYLDWRNADDPDAALKTGDFAPADHVLDLARASTVRYLEEAWTRHLL